MQTININLFGGPGTGKSTTASGIFHEMKTQDIKIEYIQEYAKDLVYTKNFEALNDQLRILAEQHHRVHRVQDHVDFTIQDSPFIMGLSYLKDNTFLPKDTFKKLALQMHNSYLNINIFLERNLEEHAYQEYGREQNLSEALEKDEEIKKLLSSLKIPYITVTMGTTTVQEIIEIALKRKEQKLVHDAVSSADGKVMPKYCTVTIKKVQEFPGGKLEKNWRMNTQLVQTQDGKEYVNTPHISGDVFREGETVSVGFGNTHGSSGKKYLTINKNS